MNKHGVDININAVFNSSQRSTPLPLGVKNMDSLLLIDSQLFQEECEVTVTEHPDDEAAKAFVAECLAGDELSLEVS